MAYANPHPDLDAVTAAAQQAGITLTEPRLLRNGNNVLYQVTDHLVARVGRPGTAATAARELAISGWLADHHFPVVTAARPHPTVVAGRPVTWWALLPPHRPATGTELGATLRALHTLPIPAGLDLIAFDPLEGIAQRIDDAQTLPADDRAWLHDHLADLHNRYAHLPDGRPYCLLHGDAWQGNIAVPTTGPTLGTPILLDLEHATIGPPEWDLTAFTADYTDFARITTTDYLAFTTTYRHDLTDWPGYRTLADIQELRWLAFILTKITTTPAARLQARHRIACLRGHIPRPWTWDAF